MTTLSNNADLGGYGVRSDTTAAPGVPSATWRMLGSARGKQKLPKGLDALWDSGVGIVRRSMLRRHRYLNRANQILASQARFGPLSEGALRDIAERMRDKFRLGRETPDDLDTAYGLIRELVYRQFGFRLHRSQVAAALALHFGCIAELATGEGKTLAATLPAIVVGWRGRGCHVITVNDYLATRDLATMKPLYEACGLSAAAIDGEMRHESRRAAYQADVTYVTNKEVAADFLRDRLALGQAKGLTTTLVRQILARGNPEEATASDQLVMRGLESAIIDEADSVLIDEAVTPLIIAGDAPNAEQMASFVEAHDLANRLEPEVHFEVDVRYKEINFTAAGRIFLREITREMGGMWSVARRREELISQAITAREFYKRDEQYVIQPDEDGDDRVVIIDEGTGRLQPDRTWREGLHQAIEAKEKVKLTPPKETLARVSFQRFFRMYRHMGGMTGTAEEARNELWQIYHRPAVPIPTHRPCIREQSADRVFVTEEAKWHGIVAEIERVHADGRPILVGTRSVESTKCLSALLDEAGIEHRVLNAVNHDEEAAIVAEAGQAGRVTVATNMAGRGTDIKLGPNVRDKGGLHVIVAERNESGRVDRQLFGRAGRQGDPGSCAVFVSLEDELIRRYGSRLSTVTWKTRGDGSGELSAKAARMFRVAQRKAESVALNQRKNVLRNDDWLDDSLGFAGLEL